MRSDAMRAGLACFMLLVLLPASAAMPAPQQGSPKTPGAEKVEVSLVLIDVVVRDRKDHPISGLTRDDFELMVDDTQVPAGSVESVEEICPARQGGRPAATPGALRHIVVYLDFSQMTMGGRQRTLRAARQFVANRLEPLDRVMIIAHKRELRLVEKFTADAPLLASRIDALLDDTSTLDTEVLEESHNIRQVVGQRLNRREAATAFAIQEEQRARRSLDALGALMPALAGLRGRKALVLFTDVLRDEPGVQYFSAAGTTPKAAGIDIGNDMLRLTRAANAAGVAIFTVHAGGLDDAMSAGGTDADPGESLAAAATGQAAAMGLQTTLAAETGGRALRRTNDVGAILTAAQQDLSCYYLIGYRHAARGDGRRHSLNIRLNPDRAGEPRPGLVVRHRPYYTDESPKDRRERLLRSALDIPDLYRALPVVTEAFALAPGKSGRKVLIKATMPMESLTLTPAAGATLEGLALVRGRVMRNAETLCAFKHDLALKLTGEGRKARKLVYETGCVLPPGSYDLTVAVLDHATNELGARSTTLRVPAAVAHREAYLGDVQLWARDPEAVLVAAGVTDIGMKDSSGKPDMMPRSERRITKSQEALLSYLICPPAGMPGSALWPINVKQAIVGEKDESVAKFGDLRIIEPPDADTGCYQISNLLPRDKLGSGIYTFTIQVAGPSFPSTLTRRAAVAVQ